MVHSISLVLAIELFQVHTVHHVLDQFELIYLHQIQIFGLLITGPIPDLISTSTPIGFKGVIISLYKTAASYCNYQLVIELHKHIIRVGV